MIGLLGGICSGKSHVARRIAALGPGRVVDADRLAHEALAAAAEDGRLAAALGPEALGPDGAPDTGALGRRVFDDPQALSRLEALVHPPVAAAVREAVRAHRSGEGPAVLVLDVPLLIEAGLDRECDELWYIHASDEVRRARALARGWDGEDVHRREGFQRPLARKRARADRVIVNDPDPGAGSGDPPTATAEPPASITEGPAAAGRSDAPDDRPRPGAETVDAQILAGLVALGIAPATTAP